MNGRIGINGRRGINGMDGESLTDFYLIKDGVIASGYTPTPVRLDSYGYNAGGFYRITDNDISTSGIYINVDLTNINSIDFIVKDYYGSGRYGRVGISNASQFDQVLSQQDILSPTFVTKTINVSAITGVKAICLVVYNQFNTGDTYQDTKDIILKQ